MAGHFLQSKAARNFNLRDVDSMSEDDAFKLFVRLRWGHGGKQVCPACGVVEDHYFIRTRRQFRCKEKGCGKTFSVTSGTAFSDRKLPFKVIVRAAVIYVTHPKGISALAFSALMGVAFMAGFSLLHKLREALCKTRDLTPLKGVIHMDGAHFCGRPRKTNKKRDRVISKYGHGGRLSDVSTANHPNRRIAIVMRELYPEKGKGARRTIVAFARSESAAVVTALAHRYIEHGSTVMTDESGAFSGFGQWYDHRTVNHDVEYVTDDGVNNNQAESFWARAKRMVRGQLHRITPHYLLEYLNENAWREDVRRVSQRERVEILLTKALRSGRSQWWTGYWQGIHRAGDLEFTV